MCPNRVPSWANFGDERDDEDGPSADDAPAILRLDPAGPPSVRQQSQEASLYLTRSNPYTFLSSEADARRLASTSRWLTVDTVGLEDIREKYGDDAIPEDYEPNPEADPTLGGDSDAEEDAVEATAADSDVDGVTTGLGGEAETEGQGYTRAELNAMEWSKLRSLAKDSDHEDIDGRSSKEEILNALAVDVDSERDSGDEAEDTDTDDTEE